MLQFHVQMGYQITETLFAVQATPPVLQGLSVRYRQGQALYATKSLILFHWRRAMPLPSLTIPLRKLIDLHREHEKRHMTSQAE
jgi:hypothetical protein